MTDEQLPTTLRALLLSIDDGWAHFRGAAARFPAGRMNEHLDDTDPASWTRKQMLAHVAAWHDLTADRLDHLVVAGQTSDAPQNVDAFNAQVARRAVGRTAGEVIEELDMSFSRLRRHIARMTDAQLAIHDAWAAHVIAGNTFDHYAEHMADLALPQPPEGEVDPPG